MGSSRVLAKFALKPRFTLAPWRSDAGSVSPIFALVSPSIHANNAACWQAVARPLPLSKGGRFYLIAEQSLPARVTIASPGIITNAILAAGIGHALCAVKSLESRLAGAIPRHLTESLLRMATTAASWAVAEGACPAFIADTLPRLRAGAVLASLPRLALLAFWSRPSRPAPALTRGAARALAWKAAFRTNRRRAENPLPSFLAGALVRLLTGAMDTTKQPNTILAARSTETRSATTFTR